MAKRTHTLDKAGMAIPAVLQESKLLTPYRFFQAKRDWHTLMGEQIAKYSYIKDVQKHCVIIGVLNSVWMNHLFIYQQQIIDTLNDYIGEPFIESVRFVRSGRKPVPVVYESLSGEEEMDTPDITIRDVVLSPEYVAAVRKKTAPLPQALREKIEAACFAKEKRRLAYEAAGIRRCPRCGRWLEKGEDICLFCRREERQHKKQLVHDLLLQMPWLSLDDFCEIFPEAGKQRIYTELYNEVRRDCIYKLIERVYHGVDTSDDDLFLAMFITRLGPSQLTDDHIRNLTNKYRKKD